MWKVWTVTLWLWRWRWTVLTVRLDATVEPMTTAQQLQRARAAGSEPLAAAAAAGAHTAEKERAHAQRRAAAEDVALDVASLTEWYRTKSHVRDAERVARAAVRRGLDDVEADEIRDWLRQRQRRNQANPDAMELSDAEREWMKTRGG